MASAPLRSPSSRGHRSGIAADPDSPSCGRALRRSRRLRAWGGRRESARRRRPLAQNEDHVIDVPSGAADMLGKAPRSASLPMLIRSPGRRWPRFAGRSSATPRLGTEPYFAVTATHQTGDGNPRPNKGRLEMSVEQLRRCGDLVGHRRRPDRQSRQNGAPGRDRQVRRGRSDAAGHRRTRRKAPGPIPCRRTVGEGRPALAVVGPRDALHGPGPGSKLGHQRRDRAAIQAQATGELCASPSATWTYHRTVA